MIESMSIKMGQCADRTGPLCIQLSETAADAICYTAKKIQKKKKKRKKERKNENREKEAEGIIAHEIRL